MKKTLVSLSLLATFSIVTAAQAASTGTITFTGLLTDTTCDVSVNGGGPSATVKLPAVSVSNLSRAGEVAGRTDIRMNLSKCIVISKGGASTVSAFFETGDTVDVSTGRLKNIGGQAGNVDLQLLDGSNKFAVIKAGNTSQVDSTKYITINQATGTALLRYAVQYYATAKTTPGTVTSSVTYSLQYK